MASDTGRQKADLVLEAITAKGWIGIEVRLGYGWL